MAHCVVVGDNSTTSTTGTATTITTQTTNRDQQQS